jgi:hypothetical protein
MATLIEGFPHKVGQVCHLTSVRDLLRFAGHDLSEAMVCEIGNASMFAYVKYGGLYMVVFLGRPFDFFQRWAARTGAGLDEKESSSSFRAAWRQVTKLVGRGQPVVLGPLDLRHLPFYPVEFDVPWHYVVLVGYDDGNAFVYDNRMPGLQSLALEDLDRAWRRRSIKRGPYAFTLFEPPRELRLPQVLVESLRHTVHINLHPPLDFVGIPGMRKLASEIGRWPAMLSADRLKTAVWSFILQSDMRRSHMFSTFLAEAGDVLGWRGLHGVAGQVFACDEAWTELRYQLKDADADGATADVLHDVGEAIARLADREEMAFRALAGLLPG